MGEIHASHPNHKLELKNYTKHYTCDGCKLQGVGPRYRCEECNYDLHQQCMFYNYSIRPGFSTNSIFNFYFFLPSHHHQYCERYCSGCGKPVRGFMYHCEKDGRHLHPGCMNLPDTVNIGGVSMMLRNEAMSKKCSVCSKRRLEGSVSGIRGWSYVSWCKKYHLHVHCAMEKNHDQICKNEALAIQLRKSTGGNGKVCLNITKTVFKVSLSLLTGDLSSITDIAQQMFSG